MGASPSFFTVTVQGTVSPARTTLPSAGEKVTASLGVPVAAAPGLQSTPIWASRACRRDCSSARRSETSARAASIWRLRSGKGARTSRSLAKRIW